MSKTTQENPAVENSDYGKLCQIHQRVRHVPLKVLAQQPSQQVVRLKRARPRRASTRTKTPASNPKTASKSTTQTSVQQDNTMSQNTVRRVAIIGGNRIPFARSNGAYFTAFKQRHVHSSIKWSC